MPSVSTQFYATPEEILAIANRCRERLDLTALLCEPRRPAEGRRYERPAEPIPMEDLASVAAGLRQQGAEICLFKGTLPMVQTRDDIVFSQNHVGGFALGWERDGDIEESCFGVLLQDETCLAVARKIQGAIRRATTAGMTARHPETGAEATYRSFRYSPGAEAAYDNGKRLIPLVGRTIVAPARPS